MLADARKGNRFVMKTLLVIPNCTHESSGPTYCFINLCRMLMKQGCDVEACSLSASELPPQVFRQRVFQQHRFPIFALGRSPELARYLKQAIPQMDVVHSNGLWMMPNIYPGKIVTGLRRKGLESPKLVTSPHGTLATWALKRSAWKKRLIGWFGQDEALAATDLFVATCEKEYMEIRAAGFRQPVAIVPIGMEIPSGAETARPRNGEKRTVAFFGRIHKVKAVDSLVLAWEKASARHPAWELVVAGPDGGMVEALKAIIAERKIANVRFTGEINGAAKYAFLSSVDLYVLPSHTENFGVTVAEALACGTPVIASRHTPWGGVVENRCGWCVSNDVGTLAVTLDEAMSLPQETLKGMGVRGREWIRRDFSWEKVGRTMLSAYEWLCRGGARPACVRVD